MDKKIISFAEENKVEELTECLETVSNEEVRTQTGDWTNCSALQQFLIFRIKKFFHLKELKPFTIEATYI